MEAYFLFFAKNEDTAVPAILASSPALSSKSPTGPTSLFLGPARRTGFSDNSRLGISLQSFVRRLLQSFQQ